MSDNSKPAVAIIGSGMAGLAAATRLTDRFSVSLFDKSRGLSGRMSTRRAEAHGFDHGAQYFRAESQAFNDWLAPLRNAGHVHEWHARGVTIAADGTVAEKVDSAPKLVFAPSMNAVGKVIVAGRPQIKAFLDCPIDKVSGRARAWHLYNGADSFGPFVHVVLAIPAAQALALLPEGGGFTDTLKTVKMIGCHTLMLGYADGEASLPDWDCAYFDDEVLGFVAVNSRKPMRGGGAALVIQTNHIWSEAHIETDMEEVSEQVKQRLAALTGLQTKASGYDRLHRWRYASTPEPAGQSCLHDMATGVSAIGDWCLGSKVESAFTSGYALADKLQKIM